jgi:hypothetical protein
MSKVAEVQSATIPYINLVLNTEDPNGTPVSTTYRLVYDYRAIARVEETLNVDLKSFECWKQITSAMTPQLVHAGLARCHPDVTIDQVLDNLNPSTQRPLQDALFEYLFPGVLEAMKKMKAEGETKNVESEASQSV